VTGIIVWSAARRATPPIYLLDAAAEVVLVGLWAFAWRLGQ